MELVLFGLVTCSNLALGTAIFFQGKKSKSATLFSLIVFSIVGWSASNYLADYFAGSGDNLFYSLIFTRATIISSIFIGGLFLLFCLIFPRDLRSEASRRRWLTSLILITGFIALISLTNLVISDVTNTGGSVVVVTGKLYVLFIVYLISSMTAAFYALFLKYKMLQGLEKQQIKYIFVGAFITTVLASITNLFIPLVSDSFHASQYGPFFTIVFVVSTAYSITKHGLFSLKLILTEIAAAALVVINVAQVVTSSNLSELILRLLLLLLVCLSGYLLVKSVQNEISRREEVEKLAEEKTGALTELEQRNKNLATLQKVSEIVMNETDMMQMTQHILDEFPKQMDDCIGALLNVIKEGKLVPYAFTQNDLTKKIRSVIGDNLEQYSQPLQPGFNLLHDSLLQKKQLDSNTLSDFISPPIPKPVALTVQRLIGAQHFEAMPLYAGGEPFGVMLFVFSQAASGVHEKNLQIAKSIADEMSLAIQRAQAFQKLKEANEYLQQLDKMKDEFISMASHELNTPLAAIEGYLSMILDEGMGKVDDKSREYLNRAYDSSKRLAALILDLLNVSRIEQGRLKMKFAQVNLVDIAEAVIKELQVKSDAKKIYLKVEADKTKVPLTWCDPDRIRQVMTNLAGNAIKFTETGGVTIKVSGDDKLVHVAVVDTGRGIAKEDQKLLFNKFSQVKREVDEHQGTGLGLYISKNYIELHQGKIWVESEAGKGATFKFDLPVLAKPPLEVKGAVLENPINAPQIELRNDTEIPQIITDSSKKPAAEPTVVPSSTQATAPTAPAPTTAPATTPPAPAPVAGPKTT